MRVGIICDFIFLINRTEHKNRRILYLAHQTKSFVMRLTYLLITLIFLASCSDKKEMLFNGKNLEGWTIYVEDESVNPDEYFYVNDGMIETVGKPIGYARTNKEYENYKLHIEWRYPEEPTNSGVFVHVKGPDMLWVSHYQGQLKHENAGDFIIHGVESATINGKVYTSTKDDKPLIAKQHPTNEKQNTRNAQHVF